MMIQSCSNGCCQSRGNNRKVDNWIIRGYGSPSPLKEKAPLAKKKLRDLLLHIGKNQKLVSELASKKTKKERVQLLQDYKIIASADDLPTKEEADNELRQLLAPCADLEDLLRGLKASAFICVIVSLGSYED